MATRISVRPPYGRGVIKLLPSCEYFCTHSHEGEGGGYLVWSPTGHPIDWYIIQVDQEVTPRFPCQFLPQMISIYVSIYYQFYNSYV